MKQKLYLLVTPDKYEYPIVITDNVSAMSRITGDTKQFIQDQCNKLKSANIKHRRPRWYECVIVDFEKDEDW